MTLFDLLKAKKGIGSNWYAKLVAKALYLPSDYERIAGIVYGASTYYLITDFKLTGSDTVKLAFSATKACNVFGAYTTSSASDNYSLYVSTTSSSKYLRYNGGTYSSYIPPAKLGERIDVVITPTGSHGMPTDDTWQEQEFTASVDMCIGTTAVGASSSKLDGTMYGDFIVLGRFHGIPCRRKTDDTIGYYDTVSKTFYEPIGNNPTAIEN